MLKYLSSENTRLNSLPSSDEDNIEEKQNEMKDNNANNKASSINLSDDIVLPHE